MALRWTDIVDPVSTSDLGPWPLCPGPLARSKPLGNSAVGTSDVKKAVPKRRKKQTKIPTAAQPDVSKEATSCGSDLQSNAQQDGAVMYALVLICSASQAQWLQLVAQQCYLQRCYAAHGCACPLWPVVMRRFDLSPYAGVNGRSDREQVNER